MALRPQTPSVLGIPCCHFLDSSRSSVVIEPSRLDDGFCWDEVFDQELFPSQSIAFGFFILSQMELMDLSVSKFIQVDGFRVEEPNIDRNHMNDAVPILENVIFDYPLLNFQIGRSRDVGSYFLILCHVLDNRTA